MKWNDRQNQNQIAIILGRMAIWTAVAVPGGVLYGQFGPEPGSRAAVEADSALAERSAEAAKKAFAANQAQYKNNADMLVLPGLLANKRDQWVRIYGRAAGLAANDNVEFFLIPENSGKDYEAMIVAFAKPSDVHQALVFIGMNPGTPVNYAKNQYWPKGERASMTIEWEPSAGAGTKKVQTRRARVEDLVLDLRSKKPMPKDGLVFTGSYWIVPQEGAKPMYAADVSDSQSIGSMYNEPSTVLDVPFQWSQGEVYGSLKLSPDFGLARGQAVQILLEPEFKDGRTRVRELSLRVSSPPGKAGLQAARYSLTDLKERPAAEGDSLVHLLAAFGRMTEAHQDPFITVHMDDGMTLRSVKEFYGLLQSIDKSGGIRVEPPPKGELFYRAFFPKEEWRNRAKRLGRPWELHLGEQEGKTAGMLILPADEIDNNGGKGDLTFGVSSAQEMARILAEKSDRWSQTVYIFAPASMTSGKVMDFVRPAMKTHETMYVFVE